jgi:hypothetical protein
MRAVAPIGQNDSEGTNPVELVTSFPKGKALADWLTYVDPSVPYGKVKCDNVYNTFKPADPAKSQTWGQSIGLGGKAGMTVNPRFLTINTPVGKPVEAQCGKAVHLDVHINGLDKIDTTFPAGCSSPFRAAEETVAFFFFDLSSCIQKDGEAPKAPPIK